MGGMDAGDVTSTNGPVRLVAVDMDGTFLDTSSSYDRDRFARLYERLEAERTRFVVASGNQYWQLRGYFDGFPDVLYIAENGAVIATTDEVLRVTPFEPRALAAAIDLVDALPGVFNLVCGLRSAYALRHSDPSMVAFLRRYYTRLALVDAWADIDDTLVKLALVCEPGQTPRLLRDLADGLPDGIIPVSSGHGSIDLISRGVNKGIALAWLGERLGIDPAQMIAFGDGGNDVEMLALAGVGVAMANAPQEIRDRADAIAGTNDEHAVLAYLERVFA